MARKRTDTSNRSPKGRTELSDAVVAGLLRNRDQLVRLNRDDDESAVAMVALDTVRAGRGTRHCVVIAADESRLNRIGKHISEFIRPGERIGTTRLVGKSPAREIRSHGRGQITLTDATTAIDRLRQNDRRMRSFRTCIVDAINADAPDQFGADLQFIYTKLHKAPRSAAFVPYEARELELLLELLRRPVLIRSTDFSRRHFPAEQRQSEEHAMSDLPIDKDDLKQRITEILKQIHEEEDPIVITRIKRLVKKHTTIFNRGYITAYLLKESLGGAPSRKRAQPRATEVSADQQSIFVSIGRNRRVHTRDLITFFTSADGITRDDIGQVKVLDNYSFVEVSKEKAQTAIEALNGVELRGRKLTVNLARRK